MTPSVLRCLKGYTTETWQQTPAHPLSFRSSAILWSRWRGVSFWDLFCFLGMCHACRLLLHFVPCSLLGWVKGRVDGEGCAELGVLPLGFSWEQ